MEISIFSDAARHKRTLIGSCKCSKKVEVSWWLPWATRRALYLLTEPSEFMRTSKITLLGIINFLSTNEMLTSVLSNTFCKMRELISFCRAKVHFSGLGDFVMEDIERGIQMDDEEPYDWRWDIAEVCEVNVLTGMCYVGAAAWGGVTLTLTLTLIQARRGVV